MTTIDGMMKQFEISVQNRPGEISRVTEILGRNAVNIRGICMGMNTATGSIRIITDDEKTASHALEAAGMSFSEKDVMTVSLPDRPGELSKITKTLAKAGINVESLYILGSSSTVERMALGVDQMEKANEVLWKYLD
ncbi:MAG: ACT domain-containing protein [Methanomassiliicoccales archaeon]